MDMQFYVDEDNGGETLTLKEFVAILEQGKWNGYDTLPFTITKPHSYRGYYERVAFEIIYASQPIEDAISLVRGAVGMRYEGYKGGQFLMTSDTLCYFSLYGTSSGAPVSTDCLNTLGVLQEPS